MICKYCGRDVKYIECHYFYKHHISIENIRKEFNGYCKICRKGLDLPKNRDSHFQIYCSKKCKGEDRSLRKRISLSLKQKFKNHPEIKEKQRETYKSHLPEFRIKQSNIIKRVHESHPEIRKKQQDSRNETFIKHPEIRRGQSERMIQKYKDHPEIKERISSNLKRAYKNNTEIRKKIVKSYKQTIKDHPEIIREAHNKARKTLLQNPEIRIQARVAYQKTLLNHPEIIEKSHDKQYQTMKERGFISKPEQKMIQLLKDKYGENDIIEQYRDDRYKKPGTNYRYACDCYIKSLDLFIEYNGSRFHPEEGDVYKLEEELEKFRLKYPGRSMKECQAYILLKVIESDKVKTTVARERKLNYLVVRDDFNELYNKNIL